MVLKLILAVTLLAQGGSPGDKTAIVAAESAFEAGNYTQAVKTLTAAHNAAPQNAAIEYWLARAYYEEKDYDNAIAHGEQAVKLDPSNGEYYRWLGRAYGGKAEESHSFFLARKVKQTLEVAVKLAPLSIEARRDLMQFLVEAPWIVGGDKDKAKEEVQSISQIDPVEGRLARAAYLATDKKWDQASLEYLAVIDQRPDRIEPYIEAAEFFAARKDGAKLQRVVSSAAALHSPDPRLDFYRAVGLILNRTDLPKAEALLHSYMTSVPPRSDYPSHNQAQRWLDAAHS